MIKGEFYKEKLEDIEKNKKGVAIVSDKPEPCEAQCCTKCIRYTGRESACSDLAFVKWYNSEYIPPKPKLNERQKAFCKCFALGWIVRQPNGVLLLFNWKPVKKESGYYTKRNGDPVRYINMSSIMFPEFLFIKNDDEPINIYEMLTWEVEE